MPGDRCAVCGITKATDPNVSFHRIPKDPIMRAKWTDALHLQKENLGSSSLVCSRHFQNGDPRNSPSLFYGSVSNKIREHKELRTEKLEGYSP